MLLRELALHFCPSGAWARGLAASGLCAHRAGGHEREAREGSRWEETKQPSGSQCPASDLPSRGPRPLSLSLRPTALRNPRPRSRPPLGLRALSAPLPHTPDLLLARPHPFSKRSPATTRRPQPSDKPLPRSRFSSTQSITWRAQKPADDLRQPSSGLPLSVKASGCGLLSWLVSRVQPPTLLHKKIKTELEPRARRLKRARG